MPRSGHCCPTVTSTARQLVQTARQCSSPRMGARRCVVPARSFARPDMQSLWASTLRVKRDFQCRVSRDDVGWHRTQPSIAHLLLRNAWRRTSGLPVAVVEVQSATRSIVPGRRVDVARGIAKKSAP
jgi:hypothetical protein